MAHCKMFRSSRVSTRSLKSDVNGGNGVNLYEWNTRIPDHAPVLDPDVLEIFVDGAHSLDSLIQGFLSPEK